MVQKAAEDGLEAELMMHAMSDRVQKKKACADAVSSDTSVTTRGRKNRM
jgi:hypothetical protein